MDDKQKLFRLTKRLNADGARAHASGDRDRSQPTSRASSSRNSRQYTNMDTITAQMKAQMLDGDAALLDLANEPDEGLLLQVWPGLLNCPFQDIFLHCCLQSHMECKLADLPKKLQFLQSGQVDAPYDDPYTKRRTSQRQGRLPDEVELPKIRVVVRKRPLNQKVTSLLSPARRKEEHACQIIFCNFQTRCMQCMHPQVADI